MQRTSFSCLLIFLIPLLLGIGINTVQGLSPVVFIPGDGGNRLEAKLDRSGCPNLKPSCSAKSDWFRLWLDVWQLTTNSRLQCWADNIRIFRDPQSGKNQNACGVETRVPGWGDTSSVEYIDPSWSAWLLKDAGNYAHTLVDTLTGWGYKRGKNLVAAPYDFRFAVQSQTSYFKRLKSLIELTRSSSGDEKVVIISHSLGGLFATHFLNTVSDDWKTQNIKAFIPIGTPWLGTSVTLNIFISGYDLGISIVDASIIKDEQRSYETAAQLLPRPEWPTKNYAHVITPELNVTASNYDQLFFTLNFEDGRKNYEAVMAERKDLTMPGVDVYCIYSRGIDTVSRLIYERHQSYLSGRQPDRRLMGDGDGTVNLDSLRWCESWKAGSSAKSNVVTKVFHGIDHGGTLKSKDVIAFIKTILL